MNRYGFEDLTINQQNIYIGWKERSYYHWRKFKTKTVYDNNYDRIINKGEPIIISDQLLLKQEP